MISTQQLLQPGSIEPILWRFQEQAKGGKTGFGSQRRVTWPKGKPVLWSRKSSQPMVLLRIIYRVLLRLERKARAELGMANCGKDTVHVQNHDWPTLTCCFTIGACLVGSSKQCTCLRWYYLRNSHVIQKYNIVPKSQPSLDPSLDPSLETLS